MEYFTVSTRSKFISKRNGGFKMKLRNLMQLFDADKGGLGGQVLDDPEKLKERR